MSLNILMVDDSETVRAVIAKTLSLAQIPINELHQASNGEEALTLLKDHWIDLILCDINMPVMSGIEMIERLQADEVWRAIPVVVISTEGSATRIERLKSHGIRAYIRKPFTPEQIREVVEEIIGAIDERGS